MRIYLDTSAINRIFDNQSDARIFLEASSMIIVFFLIENEIIELVNSDVLVFENNKNPYRERKVFVKSVLARATIKIELNEVILDRAKEIEKMGVKSIDALHVACAETSNSDYFITCDKRIIKKYQSTKINIKNPIDFISEKLQED